MVWKFGRVLLTSLQSVVVDGRDSVGCDGRVPLNTATVIIALCEGACRMELLRRPGHGLTGNIVIR
jgi:hypothetical protein